MSSIMRHQAGAQVAGQKTGGQFKAHERAAATLILPGSVTHDEREATPVGVDFGAPAHTHLTDETDLDALNRAVNLEERSARIRELWDESRNSPEAVAECAALVRDAIQWRYPAADHVILTEGGDGDNLFIAEVRDVDGNPIAHDTTFGYLEEGERDYGNTYIMENDETFTEATWAFVDGVRCGPGFAEPVRIDGSEQYRLMVRPASPDPSDIDQVHARSRILHEPTMADQEETAREIAYRGHPDVPRYAPDGSDSDSIKLLMRQYQSGYAVGEAQEKYDETLRRNAQASAVARHWKAGIPHPLESVIEANFGNPRINPATGNTDQLSRETTEESLRFTRELRDRVMIGKTPPDEIVNPTHTTGGPGGLKAAALRQLDDWEATHEKVISTGGRHLVRTRYFSIQTTDYARRQILGEVE